MSRSNFSSVFFPCLNLDRILQKDVSESTIKRQFCYTPFWKVPRNFWVTFLNQLNLLPEEPGFFWTTGSFLVKPGCTLTAWDNANYEGNFRDFEGTLLESDNTFGQDNLDPVCVSNSQYGFGSWKCRCQQKMLVSDEQLASTLKLLSGFWFP